MNTKFKFSALTILLFTLSACTQQKKGEATQIKIDERLEDAKVSTDEVDDFTDFKFRVLISNTPSPYEIITKIIFTDIHKKDIKLIDHNSFDQYLTESELALALGAFGADFTFTTLNNKKGDALNYLKAIKKLCTALGLEKQYNNVADQYAENLENPSKGELMKLSDDLYVELDNYLISASKEKIATGIITGSWIESFYLTLPQIITTSENDDNREIYDAVWEQKEHFKNLFVLLSQYQSDPTLNQIYKSLAPVNQLIESMQTTDRKPAYMSKLYSEVEKSRMRMLK